MKVYKVIKDDGLSVSVGSPGRFSLYKNDLVFISYQIIDDKNTALVNGSNYPVLTRLYYKSPQRFEPQSVDESIKNNVCVGYKMCWLNNLKEVNPTFCSGSIYFSLQNKNLEIYLEDITVSWKRDNILEEIGI